MLYHFIDLCNSERTSCTTYSICVIEDKHLSCTAYFATKTTYPHALELL